MKEKLLYICEICGEEFENQADCIRCETHHISDPQIVNCSWKSIKEDKDGFPEALMVKFNRRQDTIVRYVKEDVCYDSDDIEAYNEAPTSITVEEVGAGKKTKTKCAPAYNQATQSTSTSRFRSWIRRI